MWLVCFHFIIIISTIVSEGAPLVEGAEAQTSFIPSTTHNHTQAFNVVHVIAAAIGIVGAATIAIVAFVMCRRRRRHHHHHYPQSAQHQHQQQYQQHQQVQETTASALQQGSCIIPPKHIRVSRPISFNQFQSDFCSDNDQQLINPSSPSLVSSRIAILPHHHRRYADDDQHNSPAMQQLELQYRLMQTSSSASTVARPAPSPPPPPYHP